MMFELDKVFYYQVGRIVERIEHLGESAVTMEWLDSISPLGFTNDETYLDKLIVTSHGYSNKTTVNNYKGAR